VEASTTHGRRRRLKTLWRAGFERNAEQSVEIYAYRRVCAPGSFLQGDHPAHEQGTIEREVPLPASPYIFSDEGPTDHFCTRMLPLRFLS